MAKKIKISDEAYEKAKEIVEKKGYSSVEELLEHLVDKEYTEHSEGGSEEDRLKGLGYIS